MPTEPRETFEQVSPALAFVEAVEAYEQASLERAASEARWNAAGEHVDRMHADVRPAVLHNGAYAAGFRAGQQCAEDVGGSKYKAARDTLDLLWNLSQENRDTIALHYGVGHSVSNPTASARRQAATREVKRYDMETDRDGEAILVVPVEHPQGEWVRASDHFGAPRAALSDGELVKALASATEAV